MTIMITGGTGQLGNLIIANLLVRVPATEIIAGVRNGGMSATLKALKDQGGEVRCIDYDKTGNATESLCRCE
ncbi:MULTISPECIES: KR domain-containing protein [Paenibacillus]|uniref:KR domain-containing protein n=1 Tax=Paenibacillus TaxID=44249 RepID=UPI0020D05AC2|nr:KR domain-containing protein [Paenibacillus sp. 7523-1]